MVYGYCRVSSKEQNLDRQLLSMKVHDVPEKNLYCDKESGKDFNRPAWQTLIRKLRPGDVLYIKSIDRLGRNYDEILKMWRIITEKDVGIVVLDMPILNTANDRDLTGRLIADIVLQLLSYVAETERAFIKERQRRPVRTGAPASAGRMAGNSGARLDRRADHDGGRGDPERAADVALLLDAGSPREGVVTRCHGRRESRSRRRGRS